MSWWSGYGRSDKVTVFATYASLGLGTLEPAHAEGLPGWSLITVDEAHRTSGRIGKPWAVVHDNTRIPAPRRLYMTATPRLWQLNEDAGREAPPARVASMDDDPEGPFDSRAYTLALSEAVDRGICAPYQVVCVDITDTQLQAAQLLGVEGRSDEVRGARLAALQTALVKASSEEGFRHTLVFHHMVKEAEASAAGLPDIAKKLHYAEPELYPRTIWADWLCGEHKPLHPRRVLDDVVAIFGTPRTRSTFAREVFVGPAAFDFYFPALISSPPSPHVPLPVGHHLRFAGRPGPRSTKEGSQGAAAGRCRAWSAGASCGRLVRRAPYGGTAAWRVWVVHVIVWWHPLFSV
ncbi:hypothetical protein [Streptomyces sp. NPDC055992]|uniref:hypothetical protein n=1 Tax=Streptomyces sp. NPDC055992 TaxID=3345673 RepID=UPI0035DAE267